MKILYAMLRIKWMDKKMINVKKYFYRYLLRKLSHVLRLQVVKII